MKMRYLMMILIGCSLCASVIRAQEPQIKTDGVTKYAAATQPDIVNGASLTHHPYHKMDEKTMKEVLAKVPIVNAAQGREHPEWGLIQLFWRQTR